MHGEHLLNSLKMYFMNVYGSWPVMTSQRRSANPSVTTIITQCIALPGRFLFSRPWDQHTNKLWDLFSFLQALLDGFFKNQMRNNNKKKKVDWGNDLNGIPAKGKVIIILCIDSGLFSGFECYSTSNITHPLMHSIQLRVLSTLVPSTFSTFWQIKPTQPNHTLSVWCFWRASSSHRTNKPKKPPQ